MSKMSYCYRDLENVSEDQRKSTILHALVARIEELREPNPSEAKEVSELFVPLFETVALDTKRQVASALSRCRYVPTKISECICTQSLEISAPFLAHSSAVTNAILCYVIATKSEYHARIIAKRDDLNRTVVRSLEALDDHGVNLALQLRGYKSDASIHIEKAETRISLNEASELKKQPNSGTLELFTGDADIYPEKLMAIAARKLEAKALAMREKLMEASVANAQEEKSSATPRLKVTMRSKEDIIAQQAVINATKADSEAITDKQFAAEEHLRQTLKDLAAGDLTSIEAEALKAASLSADAENGGLEEIIIPINQNEIQHRKYVKLLDKHVKNSHPEYFTTALADALGSSYAMAERIMGDMSGRQLAMTFNAIFAPKEMCIEALNKFFPHVGLMEGTAEGAEAMLQNWHHKPSQQKLMTWLRADRLTSATKAPALDITEADVDYSTLDANDLPYAKPIADNVDIAPTWADEPLENDWLKAIAN